MNIENFVKKFAFSSVSLVIALIVIFFVLGFLHTKFSGNAVGTVAGDIGALASGSKYNF